ncbi:hypothetical protein AHiyo4_04120 [Arthrobacter sp. Hiyo4]|nr:hypothetical protein AHiyo4_04120 [Arthrobacter sp. Hiyo4]
MLSWRWIYQRTFFSAGPCLPLTWVGLWFLPTLCSPESPPLDLLASIARCASVSPARMPLVSASSCADSGGRECCFQSFGGTFLRRISVSDEISMDGAGGTRPQASAYSKISVPMNQQ